MDNKNPTSKKYMTLKDAERASLKFLSSNNSSKVLYIKDREEGSGLIVKGPFDSKRVPSENVISVVSRKGVIPWKKFVNKSKVEQVSKNKDLLMQLSPSKRDWFKNRAIALWPKAFDLSQPRNVKIGMVYIATLDNGNISKIYRVKHAGEGLLAVPKSLTGKSILITTKKSLLKNDLLKVPTVNV